MNRVLIVESPLPFSWDWSVSSLLIQSWFVFVKVSTHLTGNSEYCPSTAERWCCPEHRNCTPVWSSWAEDRSTMIQWSPAGMRQQYKILKWATTMQNHCLWNHLGHLCCFIWLKWLELVKKNVMSFEIYAGSAGNILVLIEFNLKSKHLALHISVIAKLCFWTGYGMDTTHWQRCWWRLGGCHYMTNYSVHHLRTIVWCMGAKPPQFKLKWTNKNDFSE